MFRNFAIIILWGAISLIPSDGLTCTTFSLKEGHQVVFGKNYDWHLGRGMVIANKRGVSKTAMPGLRDDPGEYAIWTSKYGSLTFNQYGREMPMGGMNEAGLVVELMSLSETQYPQPDARHAIKDLQWIQYQLDNFSRVGEVIANNASLRILSYERPGLHFLVADKTGDCAVIEFLNGSLVLHIKEILIAKTLANNTYAESCEYLRQHEGFGGQLPVVKGNASLKRFVKSANMLKNYDSNVHGSAVDYAFHILENVSQASTKWRIVYDQEKMRVHFRTASNPNINYVDFNNLDFDCETPVKVVDIDSDLSGNIAEAFVEYGREMNLDLIRYAFKGTGLMRYLPERFIHQRATYPESTQCSEQLQAPLINQ